MTKRILITGYLGFENFGDEAILHVLINNLLLVGFNREDITVISNNPQATSTAHKVKSISRWNIFKIFFSMLSNKWIIFIGGLFQDKTSFRSFLYYLLQLFAAGFLQREIVFYACGIGPLENRFSRMLFNFGCKFIRLITVRDQLSCSLTPFQGSPIVTCDPVWSIKVDLSVQKEIQKVNWKLPVLGVSIRNDKNLRGFHLTYLVEKLAVLLNSMKDWQIVLIPCMPQEDLPILYDLHDHLVRKSASPTRVTTIDNFADFTIPQQAGILASCEVVVSMRYHALLVPIAYGKPAFGLVYDQKIKSLLDFSGQVGVSFTEHFDQPWNYFWQNLQFSTNLAKQTSEKALKLNDTNIELLKTMYNMK